MSQPDSDNVTDNQILRNDARLTTNRIADDITSTAERIRVAGLQFSREDIPASAVVAEIVNIYTQSGNAVGAMFWTLIRALETSK